MAYIPRRRLVLANARSAGVHTQWSSSEMPWDAEEEAFAADHQHCGATFEAACFTQESASGVCDWGSQPDHPLVHVDSRATEQAPSVLHTMPSYEPACTLRQQCSHAAARDHFTLPQEEYRDIYNFLTKGTGQVQEMSAVERALFKLVNLRQVGGCSIWLPGFSKQAINAAAGVQIMKLHGVTQDGRTKQVLELQSTKAPLYTAIVSMHVQHGVSCRMPCKHWLACS